MRPGGFLRRRDGLCSTPHSGQTDSHVRCVCVCVLLCCSADRAVRGFVISGCAQGVKHKNTPHFY